MVQNVLILNSDFMGGQSIKFKDENIEIESYFLSCGGKIFDFMQSVMKYIDIRCRTKNEIEDIEKHSHQ